LIDCQAAAAALAARCSVVMVLVSTVPWLGCLQTVAAAATLRKSSPRAMRLAKPTPIRLTPELLRWLDRWRGDRMSRATAIRILLEQAMESRQ